MITNTRVFISDCHDPHVNLAREDVLLRTSEAGQAILFVWQNERTVVIGAGQNAWRECDVELLKRESGALARRSTGGGAVYHDLGNLNFSFIIPRDDYDVKRQLGVVQKAVKSLGIDAIPTGRNDITVSGCKFSGNAFRILKTAALHHGTILVSSDMSVIGRYLRVSEEKLKSKGVKSVASRVVNLSDITPVTVDSVSRSLIKAFCDEYFVSPVEKIENVELKGLEEALKKYSDWEWILGSSPQGEADVVKRFDWGEVEVAFKIVSGRLENVSVFTDSMDETLKDKLTLALTGARFELGEMERRISDAIDADKARDIALWLADI